VEVFNRSRVIRVLVRRLVDAKPQESFPFIFTNFHLKLFPLLFVALNEIEK